MKTAITIVVVIVLGLGAYAYTQYAPAEGQISTTPPTFAWRFAESSELNLDGLPKTQVYIDATYGAVVEPKLIDTVDGSCNELPDREVGSLTPTVQCYWAGFGYRYKVVAGIDSYLVQRQEFEEATPDYEPPVANYEVIAEFQP